METPILLMCIAFKNYAEVASYLERTLSLPNGGLLKIVVIDNTPDKPSRASNWLLPHGRDALKEERLMVVGDGTNRGYFGAFRFGLESVSKIWPLPFVWTVLSNTDLEIHTPDWFDRLIGSDADNVAAVAPSIVSALSGKNQNPLYSRRPAPIKFALLSLLFRSLIATTVQRVASVIKGRFVARFGQHKERGGFDPIYAAHGSFICLSERYFQKGGDLACPTFLFCEEIFLAERIRDLGMEIKPIPDVKVLHQEHSTTSFIPGAPIRKHLSQAHWAAFRRMCK